MRCLCHNIAANLYFAQQYDLAIPLFEQAIAYGTMPPFASLWLAASLWVTTRDKKRTLALLAQARSHDASDIVAKRSVELSEFCDLLDDRDFQETLQGQLIAF